MTTESGVQSAVRLEYARRGYQLFRNNVGQLLDANGRPVRFGLANDSRELNARLKSSDLIGWRPRLVTPGMVGDVIAQFVSLEVKASDWTPARSGERFKHEQAQQRWIDLVLRDGGEAAFVKDVG